MKFPTLHIPYYILNTILVLTGYASTEATTEDSEIYILSDFVVSGEDDKGYYSANSTSATKTNELIKNTPINVSVINTEFIDDLGIKTIEDLSQYSASIDSDPTGYSLDQIRIRGFRNTNTRFGGFRRTIPRDSYNVSRFDIIKGANSLIYGEASPGGSVNAVPLIANFRKDAGSLIFGLGNKDYKRAIYNYNKVLSDNLAARLMILNHEQGYEHDFKKYSIDSKTLSLNFRPTSKTSVIINAEDVDAMFNFPGLSMKDKTYMDDLDTDSNGLDDQSPINMIAPSNINHSQSTRNVDHEKYDGILGVETNSSSRIFEYYVPYSPDWVTHAPDSLINYLITETQVNPVTGPNSVSGSSNSGIQINSRQDLANYYSEINKTNYGYQSGPDKGKHVDGVFITKDIQHIFSDSIEGNLSINYQENTGNNLARDYYGINKIVDSYSVYDPNYPRAHRHVFDDIENSISGEDDDSPEKFIRTYWIKTEADSKRYGSKATLLIEKNTGFSENKIILGLDYYNTEKNEINFDQIPENALNNDGSYLIDESDFTNWIDASKRATWVSQNKITDREKAYEYISIDKAFTADRSILQFNEIIESDFNVDTGYTRSNTNPNNLNTGNSSLFEDVTDQNGNVINRVRNEAAIWAESQKKIAKITSKSQWIATQSSLMDGKLRTLLGLRLDKINVSSSLRKISIYGREDNSADNGLEAYSFGPYEGQNERVNNKVNETYEKYSPSFGILYWYNKNLAIFGNYAESINPPFGQERTPVGTLAPPEYGKGVEFGFRFNSVDNKIDGQVTYYSIEKENDNEFNYSDNLLALIYPVEVYGTDPNADIYVPEIYQANGNISKAALPGRRAEGDVTLSSGVELDFHYNPTNTLSFIASVNKSLKNEITKLHPNVTNALTVPVNELMLLGRPDLRASLTGRYSFRQGKYKGLSFGVSQHYRSESPQTLFSINNERILLNFGDEHTTSGFIAYKGRLSSLKGSPRYSVTLRINNLFDDQSFVGRGNYGYYKESLSYNISTKINF